MNRGVINESISDYLEIPGVLAALLVSDEGLVIDQVQRGHADLEGFAALVTDAVSAAEHLAAELRAGGLDTLMMEFDKQSVLLAPVNTEVMLALIAAPGTFLA